MRSSESLSPVEAYAFLNGSALRFLIVIGLVAVAWAGLWVTHAKGPQRFEDDLEHFKYGSIGSDNTQRGIPYRIFAVLPEVFEDHLPAGGGGYGAFGFTVETGRDRPVGFSRRPFLGLDLVGLNCAACHYSRVREAPEAVARGVAGMPAHALDLQGFFRFLFTCVRDDRFTAESLLPVIERHAPLGALERVLLRKAIERFRDDTRAVAEKLRYWDDLPAFGPGRIDTFGPYAALLFGLELEGHVGTADFPPLWNQAPREGMALHWDGNNDSVAERNRSASIGAGNTPESMDEESLARIGAWIDDLPAPGVPAEHVVQARVPAGARLYARHCARCHAFDGADVGAVEPLKAIGTDPHRARSFSADLARRMNTLGRGYAWQFQRFVETGGYANLPLDGIWLRAPYLHNGSVPTLWDLLQEPGQRPETFYRGDLEYDFERVGFRTDRAIDGGRELFLFDTRASGNDNAGHTYATELGDEDKRDLLEFLKTL